MGFISILIRVKKTIKICIFGLFPTISLRGVDTGRLDKPIEIFFYYFSDYLDHNLFSVLCCTNVDEEKCQLEKWWRNPLTHNWLNIKIRDGHMSSHSSSFYRLHLPDRIKLDRVIKTKAVGFYSKINVFWSDFGFWNCRVPVERDQWNKCLMVIELLCKKLQKILKRCKNLYPYFKYWYW